MASSWLEKSFFPAGINGHAKCFEYAPNDYESAGSGRLGNRTGPSECIASNDPVSVRCRNACWISETTTRLLFRFPPSCA